MKKLKIMQFDPKNFDFRKVPRKIWKTVLNILAYFFITLTMAVIAYLVFALFFRTDTERKLKREIRMYEKVYPTLVPKKQLLEDAIANLQYKDDSIYQRVFNSNAPSVNPMLGMDLINSSDSIPSEKLVSYTRDKADSLLTREKAVNAVFMKIFKSLSDRSVSVPPMSMPLKDITYSQIGASVGRKMNPFLKAYVYHSGLDFIVTSGTPVYASADGKVESASTSKASGKAIEISHEGGYTSTYSHLETMDVKAGQKVSRGQKIGTVGVSGQSSAPHLHYEIRKGDIVIDPVNCLFGSVTPDQYSNMLYMAINTMQSMD